MYQFVQAHLLPSLLMLVLASCTGDNWGQPAPKPTGDAGGDGEGGDEPNAAPACEGGCYDGIACTHDDCIQGVCQFTADDRLCESGHCDASMGCIFCVDDSDCDDGVTCTIDECRGLGCVNIPSNDLCGGEGFCDESEGCLGCITQEDCDDGRDCTEDRCKTKGDSSKCENKAKHERCLFGQYCDKELDCQWRPAFYAHTESTLYKLTSARDTTPERIGSFGSGITMVDIAERADGKLYGVGSRDFYKISTKLKTSKGLEQPLAKWVATLDRFGESFEGFTAAPDGKLYASTIDSNDTIRIVKVDHKKGETDLVQVITGLDAGIHGFGDIVSSDSGTLYASGLLESTSWLIELDPATNMALKVLDMEVAEILGLTYFAGRLIGLSNEGELVMFGPNSMGNTTKNDSRWTGAY